MIISTAFFIEYLLINKYDIFIYENNTRMYGFFYYGNLRQCDPEELKLKMRFWQQRNTT